MKKVKNQYGVEIPYEAAVMLMNESIMEELHEQICPCNEQEFFTAYCERYAEKNNETWELDKENPCY